ncbi:CDP-glycerol:glycerophosphate glycerophosphotransferase [Campylobacter coli]|nr:glycosyltransferase [Campylobacter coli]EGK8185977.1 glycosyltransferase [Campylobacter coli]MBX2492736.1 CDP-glycerol glycerophosphotransferase family protein [Campylobacter coli]HED8417758.1 CDP-glycerol glycerophosphotransferase family protein [Campylobacter coli]HEQ3635618.1 CDP-glycerol glycerophosphotransferase family protein [Campylobacter coli]
MLGLNQRKLQKLKTNPKLFFKDAIEKKLLHLNSTYNKYLPKKHKGFTQYAIISAVYNVEKYLDDYFKSIINQRLDFKKNIFMILVDDGSTDNSAQIIKKYQKKYPKNIVYLYKENGGQASARNLGLKYMQENNYKTPWVTFTDPDDFLDRNYFYEVDKFLSTHKDNNICMISTKTVFYNHEKQASYEHPMKDLKWHSNCIVNNKNFLYQMPAAPTTLFLYKEIQKYNIRFKEGEHSRYGFEDVEFSLLYFLYSFYNSTLFLKSSIYFYRKNHGANTTFKALQHKEYYIGTQSRIMQLYRLFSRIEKSLDYYKNIILYYSFFPIKSLINSPEKLSFMGENEKQRYLELLDQNFSYIDKNTIVNFYRIPGFNFFYQVGILNCFKNEKPPFQIVYIEDYDPYKEQILLTYYTGDNEDIESILVDREEVYADYEKIVKYDFLDRVFCYQKRLWVHIPKSAKDKLENFIDGKQSRISFNGKHYQSIKIQDIRKEFQKRLPKSNIWILIDRDYEADDNAEHLCRYIMQNHPEQEVVFALRKESSDWERLEKEGFNLVKFGSLEFERIIKKASKIISSHSDEYLMRYITSRQQFIFLQHGITIFSDVSAFFNRFKSRLIVMCSPIEHLNIISDYTRYNLTEKEGLLTGFARHDALLKNNRFNIKQILVMPTWRKYIVGDVISGKGVREHNDEFLLTEYFKQWNDFLCNKEFEQLAKAYSYKVIFCPHFLIRDYIEYYNLPDYIQIYSREDGETLQKILQDTSLLITDYSTISCELAVAQKPTIYFQFDEQDNLVGRHHKRAQGISYHTHGFGPVAYTIDELIKQIKHYFISEKVDKKFYLNIENSFYRSKNSCMNIYKAILDTSSDYISIVNWKKLMKKARLAQDKQLYLIAYFRWQYIIENYSQNEKDIFNYIYCARKSNRDLEIINFFEKNHHLMISKKNMLELLKSGIKTNNKQFITSILSKIDLNTNLETMILKLKLQYFIEDCSYLVTRQTLINELGISKCYIDYQIQMFNVGLIKYMCFKDESIWEHFRIFGEL